MPKLLMSLFTILIASYSFGQSVKNADLIKMGKAHKDYMFVNNPSKTYLKEFIKAYPNALQKEARFIKQTISSNNKLLGNEFLSIPNQQVLKNIYIARKVGQLFIEEFDITPNELVDSLKRREILKYELVDNYYDMLFTSVGNKNKPFDFSKSNFMLDNYGLNDEVEKGIFFLKCMDFCGTNIWGYMNIVHPPNTKKALSLIRKYPRVNGNPYYQYTDLYFKDFKMIIAADEGIQSYKFYYIDTYYETLLYHLKCLNNEGETEDKINSLLLGSILKDEKLYKYSKHKQALKSLFRKKRK